MTSPQARKASAKTTPKRLDRDAEEIEGRVSRLRTSGGAGSTRAERLSAGQAAGPALYRSARTFCDNQSDGSHLAQPRASFGKDTGLQARMVLTMFLLGLVYAVLVGVLFAAGRAA